MNFKHYWKRYPPDRPVYFGPPYPGHTELCKKELNTVKKDFKTYPTESAALADMKAHRKRKYTAFYSEYWKCWICWFNV